MALTELTTTERGAEAVADLFHYGTPGMKWGVRKAEKAQGRADKAQARAEKSAAKLNAARVKKGKEAVEVSTKFGKGDVLGRGYKTQQAVTTARQAERAQKVAAKKWDKADKKWEKSVYSMNGAVAVHNAMADYCNARLSAINDKHPNADYRKGEDTPEWKAYMADINKLQSDGYSHAVSSVHGSSPSGKKRAEYFNDGKGDERVVVHSAHIQHADVPDTEPDLILLVKTDEQGRILEMNEAELGVEHSDDVSDFFEHFGVKGMHWGVRNGDYEGASRKVNKEASADAQEFARAKMFYGEGAGTRRKLIKAKVAQKSNAIPNYKAAFEHHLAKQDLSKHADKAVRERKRKDTTKSVTKTARGVNRELNGGFGNVSLASKILATGVRAATHSDESDSITASTIELGESAVTDLFHYGVKGMKWGVTTVDKASKPTLTREKKMVVAKSSNVTVTQTKPGHYARARGGKRLKATDDAVKAVAARQKAKKSTTDALTNDELRAAVERMQLEQKYAQLDAKTTRRGKGFVAYLFSNPEARARNADLLKRAAEVNKD